MLFRCFLRRRDGTIAPRSGQLLSPRFGDAADYSGCDARRLPSISASVVLFDKLNA